MPEETTKPEKFERKLASFASDYRDGNKEALFDAIAYCGTHGLLLPPWASEAFSEGWLKWGQFQRQTLGDCFGIETRGDIRKASKAGLKIRAYITVQQLLDSGMPMDGETLEQAALQLGQAVGKTLVGEYYREVRRELDAQPGLVKAMAEIVKILD